MNSYLTTALKLSITAAALASLGRTPAIAAEESCATCDRKVTFSGDFVHRRAPGQGGMDGAPAGTEDSYREGIFGSNFTATISGLPDGKYTIVVGMLAVHVSSNFSTWGSHAQC